MAKVISLPEMGIVIDGIYRNYSKHKVDQKNVNKLAADCNVSVNVLIKIRNILAARQQLIIEGERAQQKCYWNTAKSKPNPVMLTEIYREYTKDVKSRVKVKKKEKCLPSLESALQTLVKLGWTGVIEKSTTKGFVTEIKRVDLSKVEVGE